MEETRKNIGADPMSHFLNIVAQQDNMPTNQMMAMFGLYALVNILNLAQSEAPVYPAAGKTPEISPKKLDKDSLMEAVNDLVKSQGMNAGDLLGMLGAKSGSSEQNPADLLGALGKNPAALMNFMNLLTSAKEAMNAGKREEKPVKKLEEPKTIPFKDRGTEKP
ncbi:MAG: hypothetical protein GX262_07100 [Clostridia bacterium]|nr:hypothetical protein [Clostridia bacterium]